MSCGHQWQMPATDEARAIGFGVMALRYASWGYAVVPCERGGKKPHRMLPPQGGVHWASTDPAQIRGWWSNDPAASIGVATGQVSALAVIDLDVKSGHDGKVSLGEWLRSWGGQLPWPAPAVSTPSGGMHIWLRCALPVPERPSILPGVDVKGDGGLVIAPPSARLVMPLGLDGERAEPVPVPYTWMSGCPCSLPLAPRWLGHWLASAPASAVRTVLTEPLMATVDELRETGVPVGERSNTFYRLACGLYRRCGTGMDGSAVVYEQVRTVWAAGDTRDFTERELRVCVESARKFIRDQEQKERSYRRSPPGEPVGRQ